MSESPSFPQRVGFDPADLTKAASDRAEFRWYRVLGRKPRKNNAAAYDSHDWIEPGPTSKLPANQRNDGENAGERIDQHMNVSGPQIQIMMVSAA